VNSKALAHSVSGQFIYFIRKGYQALAPERQAEIKNFIMNSQHREGGFVNRAGSPDMYYSLFGVWLAISIEMDDILDNHKNFIIANEDKHKNTVDTFAFLLIRILLNEPDYKKPSLLKLLRLAFIESRQTSLFYRLFLFMLVVDSRYRSSLFWYPARPVLWFYTLPDESPCSLHAAILVIRKKVKLKSELEAGQLLSFFEEGKGFKAYQALEEADLLSTAVALFALKTAGSDLRLLAPGCFDFIEQCYSDGAFLAGNGDNYRDLEYTFYGLLALGTLV
jgi:hypothetical protein